ncbi:hypothetical protein ACQP2E_29600 [Actinoplanes sp. CA-015351]|uniref:hypothetical protein n=1 Tax=Actinoplanes sp. CA-015351 TaxID=3239897 RepID=UPI003D99A7FC
MREQLTASDTPHPENSKIAERPARATRRDAGHRLAKDTGSRRTPAREGRRLAKGAGI